MVSNADGLLYDANNDVKAVMVLISNVDSAGIIAFHAQQAAEKMVKHVFELNNVEHQKIHDIDVLLQETTECGWLRDVSPDELQNAKELSLYAVSGIYAGASITMDKALEAIEWCNQIANILERNGYPAVTINISC